MLKNLDRLPTISGPASEVPDAVQIMRMTTLLSSVESNEAVEENDNMLPREN